MTYHFLGSSFHCTTPWRHIWCPWIAANTDNRTRPSLAARSSVDSSRSAAWGQCKSSCSRMASPPHHSRTRPLADTFCPWSSAHTRTQSRCRRGATRIARYSHKDETRTDRLASSSRRLCIRASTNNAALHRCPWPPRHMCHCFDTRWPRPRISYVTDSSGPWTATDNRTCTSWWRRRKSLRCDTWRSSSRLCSPGSWGPQSRAYSGKSSPCPRYCWCCPRKKRRQGCCSSRWVRMGPVSKALSAGRTVDPWNRACSCIPWQMRWRWARFEDTGRRCSTWSCRSHWGHTRPPDRQRWWSLTRGLHGCFYFLRILFTFNSQINEFIFNPSF